jgi:DNA-binding SARP family transcriptional activator
MTEFRLLGPLEATVDGATVALPAGKPRALLARLLLDANRVVPVETLVESLWGDPAPPSARKVLQVYVSQLRKTLGPKRIETRPPGYAVRVAPDEYDLGRFERLVDAARGAESARQAELLGQALALWRGPGLVEFRHEPFAVPAARRLAELRLVAVEHRIDAELELGRHERLVGELETLVEEHPLREELRRRLMLALYRCGRQADALERYREGRRELVSELGIEPGQGLQELERAILRHDRSLEGPRAAHVRGCVVGVGANLHALLGPLAVDGREVLLVEIAREPAELALRSRALAAIAADDIRTAAFTSDDAGADVARLASEQHADLLVVDDLSLLRDAPCDVAVAFRGDLGVRAPAPVLVPFGGARDEWAALELGAWLARAHGVPLRLLGTQAKGERRDASRTLAAASLALQRFAATHADTALVEPGAEGILAQSGSLIVASLPGGELDGTRGALAERATVPLLLVRPGLRPGGLAPERTLTRFSWSLRDDPQPEASIRPSAAE